MRELQRKIKLKEAAIQQNTFKIQQQEKILKPLFRSKLFCTLEIVGSFITGFFISKNKSLSELLAFFVSQSFTISKLQRYLQTISKFKA